MFSTRLPPARNQQTHTHTNTHTNTHTIHSSGVPILFAACLLLPSFAETNFPANHTDRDSRPSQWADHARTRITCPSLRPRSFPSRRRREMPSPTGMLAGEEAIEPCQLALFGPRKGVVGLPGQWNALGVSRDLAMPSLDNFDDARENRNTMPNHWDTVASGFR